MVVRQSPTASTVAVIGPERDGTTAYERVVASDVRHHFVVDTATLG